MEHIVVVGASLAGLRTAGSLRAHGFTGHITLVGADTRMPYNRPPLSKEFLAGRCDSSALELTDSELLDDLQAQWLLGVSATALHTTTRRVDLDDGTSLRYDGLVIATGCRNRELFGRAWSNVFSLRTFDDALALRGALQSASRVVIVGAGFIGLEVASVCRELGLEVVIVEAAPMPLAHLASEAVGAYVADLARVHGVELRLRTTVEELLGAGRVEEVCLSDGTRIAADVVITAVGTIPNTEWLEGSDVPVENGVLCNADCTVVPSVVAVGDVARAWHDGYRRHLRVEHWTNAVEQAPVAAQSLLDWGKGPTFDAVPYFWSDIFGTKIQFAGVTDVEAEPRVEGDPDSRRFVMTHYRAEAPVAVFGSNSPAKVMRLRRQMTAAMQAVPASAPAEAGT